MTHDEPDEARKEFELNAEPYGYDLELANRTLAEFSNYTYANEDTQNRWWGWQAAWDTRPAALDVDGRVEKLEIPKGFALVRIDCSSNPLPDEKRGVLWVTADEYNSAYYDTIRDGYKLPIYYMTSVKLAIIKKWEKGND